MKERLGINTETSYFRTLILFIGLILLTLYLWPITKGEGMVIGITDNLDSAHSRFYILANSGKIFADSMTTIPGILHDLPRISFGSEFNVLLWLYVLFPPLEAFSINLLIIHVFAFAGMSLLLNKHFIAETIPHRTMIIVMSALLFAFIPFWPPGGLSVAGQPLALYAFLNIRKNGGKYYDWLIVCMLPFYSSFVLAYLFFLLLMSSLWLVDAVRLKKVNKPLLAAIVMMTAIYLVVEYRLVSVMLFGYGDFVSHREAFVTDTKEFWDSYREMHLIFLDGHLNAPSLQFDIVILAVLSAMVLLMIQSRIHGNIRLSVIFGLLFVAIRYSGVYMTLIRTKYAMASLFLFSLVFLIFSKGKESRIFGALFLFILLSSFGYGFWYFEGFQFVKQLIPFFEKFNFSRFYFLQSMVWYILLALSFAVFSRQLKYGILLVFFIFVYQAENAFFHRSFDRPMMNPVSYGKFFAPKVYDDIRESIGKNPKTYYVVMLGMHPTIAQLNGFQTLDGYVSNYPLQYKMQFRKAIEKELDKNKYAKQRYDTWGSSCYLFSSELGQYVTYEREGTIKNLEINTSVLYDMGGRYLLTQYTIENVDSLNLRLKAVFDSNESFWKINLYEMLPKTDGPIK